MDPRTECACSTCVSYCGHVAGWYLPEEIAPAAAALNLTVEEFFARHCTIDAWVGDTVFVLRPRLTKESGGEVSGFDPRGTCAHQTSNGLCGRRASHSARRDTDGTEGDVRCDLAKLFSGGLVQWALTAAFTRIAVLDGLTALFLTVFLAQSIWWVNIQQTTRSGDWRRWLAWSVGAACGAVVGRIVT